VIYPIGGSHATCWRIGTTALVALSVIASAVGTFGEPSYRGLASGEFQEFPWFVTTMAIGWAGALVWGVRALVGSAARWSRGVFVVAFVAVLIGVLLPGEAKVSLEAWVLDLVGPRDYFGGSVSPSTIAHGLMFGILAAVLALARMDLRGGGLVLDLALLAIATEVLQLFVAGREASLVDAGVDMVGVVVGVGLVRGAVTVVRMATNPSPSCPGVSASLRRSAGCEQARRNSSLTPLEGGGACS